jgi:hypothetical protein
VIQRRDTVLVGEIDAVAGIDQEFHDSRMPRAAIAQDDGSKQAGYVEG